MSDIDKVLGSYEHAIQAADWADTTEALAVVARARSELAALRRRAQGVDVEAMQLALDVLLYVGTASDDFKRQMAAIDALRRALARETGAKP